MEKDEMMIEDLLAAIGREAEKTEGFRRLVLARREYPDLTVGMRGISVWLRGIPDESMDDPFAFSEDESRLRMELIAPTVEEYAGLADYAHCNESDDALRLVISRDRVGLTEDYPLPISLEQHPALAALYDQLEAIEIRKMDDCIRGFRQKRS